MSESSKGILVSFEGGEGAGKGTQLKLLRPVLDQMGVKYVMRREPGGVQISEKIREILLDPENTRMTTETELMLYGAARAQIVAEVIHPLLEQGINVICDRFYDSTTAYQGFGRDLDLDFIQKMNHFVTGGLRPVRTIYLDIDPIIGLSRATTEGADRLEQETIEFHQKVREGYLWIAENEPERFKVIDGRGTIDEVNRHVINEILPLYWKGESA